VILCIPGYRKFHKIVQSNSQTTSRICQLIVDAKKEGHNNLGECSEAGNQVGDASCSNSRSVSIKQEGMAISCKKPLQDPADTTLL